MQKQKEPLYQRVQKTRVFTGVVMLAIGVSWTYDYFQLKELKKEFFENQTIVIQNSPLSNEVEVVEVKEEKTIDEKITDEFVWVVLLFLIYLKKEVV